MLQLIQAWAPFLLQPLDNFMIPWIVPEVIMLITPKALIHQLHHVPPSPLTDREIMVEMKQMMAKFINWQKKHTSYMHQDVNR